MCHCRGGNKREDIGGKRETNRKKHRDAMNLPWVIIIRKQIVRFGVWVDVRRMFA